MIYIMVAAKVASYYGKSFFIDNAMNLTAVTAQIQHTLDPLFARFIRPQLLGRVATRMPSKLNHLLVEKLVNTVFAEQLLEGDFEFLTDRVLQVEVLDAGLFVGLSFQQGRLICNHFSRLSRAAVDATLSIDSLSAIQLIQQEVDPDTLFFQRKLKINGDTELAHQVKNTIDTLNPELIPGFMLKIIDAYRSRVLAG
jgi:predicted lipid carrier protein YhbT